MDVLPLGRFRLEEIAQCRAVLRRRLLPIFLDRVPALAQAFHIGIAVLRDDGGDSLGMSLREPESHRRAVIKHVNREVLETD